MINLFDEAYPTDEQLPRRMEANLVSEPDPQGVGEVVQMKLNGRAVGDVLADVAWFSPAEDDTKKDTPQCPDDVTGARFHDTLHLAFAACLGWSPVLRTLGGYTRRSNPNVDLQEDGPEAVRTEEEIALAVFVQAREPNQDRAVDPELLASIRKRVSAYEVSARSDAEWEHAISSGIAAIQAMWVNNGGTLSADLTTRSLVFTPAPEHAGAAA
jgi:antitoxin component HigA of HigAB toxin-antitoxin module